MKTVEVRVEVGKCDLGYVFVHHFAGSPDDGGVPTEHRYEVRAGNHRVAAVGSRKEAMAIAKTLVGERA